MLDITSSERVVDAARFFCSGPLLGNAVSGAMLALGIALMLVILLRRSGRYVHKLKRQAKKSSKPNARSVQRDQQRAGMFDRTSPLLDAPSTVIRWQVEMQELARDLKAEIDTKMLMLQVLTRRADEVSQRLEAASQRAQRLGCVECSDQDGDPTSETLATLAGSQRHTRPSSPIPPYSDQVYALAAAGGNATEIASQIGLPLGDVEFVLSLRSQRGESV